MNYIDDHGHTWVPEMISIINQKFDPYYKYDPKEDQTRDLPEEDEEEENDKEPEQKQIIKIGNNFEEKGKSKKKIKKASNIADLIFLEEF